MNRKNSSGNIEYIYSHPASGEQPEEEELIQHSALPIREILRRLNALLAKTRCEDARHYLQMWQRCARGKRDWGSELVLCSELLCLLRHMKDKDAALAAVCRCQELLRQNEDAIRQADFLLFCTGWDRLWGQATYYESFPCLTAEAAAFVAGLPLKGIGEDSISLDPCDSVDFPNHITLLGAGFVNTENLKGLDRLIGRPFTFMTLPLKFKNSDGCSCRAAAIIEED